MQPTNELNEQLIMLCRKGRKIEAIKHYLEATGSGLRESKEYVDALMAGKAAQQPIENLDEQIIRLCAQGNKLAAVKLYHDAAKTGLKEAKEYVDALCRQAGPESAGSYLTEAGLQQGPGLLKRLLNFLTGDKE